MMNIAHHSRSFCNRKSLLGIRNGIALFHVDNAGRRRVTAGVVSPKRSIPSNITAPHYALDGNMSHPKPFIPILNHEQEQRLRRACQLAKEVLVFAGKHVKIGQTTDEIDRLVHDEVVRLGAYPSPLNYGGFPKSLCTSVNEIVVHGIPDSRPLESGDIINLDVSVYLDGFHGDTSKTFLVGDVDTEGKRLIDVTTRALEESIDKCCTPRSPFRSIGEYIEELARNEKFSIVKEYTGHGIGEEFHCLPFILHHRNYERGQMLPGMAFTIEPILCEGSSQIKHWNDGWTVATADGKRSAQAEHTVLITQDGVETLT